MTEQPENLNPIHISADGRWWWDGTTWRPTDDQLKADLAQKEADLNKARNKRAFLVIGVGLAIVFALVLGLAALGAGNTDSETASTSSSDSGTDVDPGSVPAPAYTPPTYTPEPAPAYTPPAPSRSDVAYGVLIDNVPSLAAVPQSALDDFAVVFCDGIDSGLTMEDLVMLGIENNFTGEEIGGLAAYSIFTECPEHENFVN